MVYKVRISAGSEKEAKEISDELIEEKMVAGTLITSGESRYHWDGEIEQQTYYNIQAYSLEGQRQKITEKVESIHSDDVPIIEYIEIEGNQKFLDWVKESLKNKKTRFRLKRFRLSATNELAKIVRHDPYLTRIEKHIILGLLFR